MLNRMSTCDLMWDSDIPNQQQEAKYGNRGATFINKSLAGMTTIQ